MNTDELVEKVLFLLDEGKGSEIRLIDVQGKTSITDFLIVVSGRSERHVKALASQVVEKIKQERQYKPLGVEGESTGEWVLVDYGDLIVHVMLPQTRAHYQLEKLWETDFDEQQAEVSNQ